MRSLILCAYFVCCSGGAGWAGAWTLPQGSSQVIVTAAYSSADEMFDDNGKAVANETFEKYELRGYGEYGVTDWATVVLQPEFRSKRQGDAREDGFGRVDLGLRLRVWQSDFAVASVEAAISAPGQSGSLVPLNGGDTDWEFDLRALYGRGFDIGWRHGFADLQIGYKHRVGEPADEVALDLTLGLDVTGDAFAMLQSFNRVSVGSADAPFGKTYEHKVALSGVYRLGDDWSVQSGVQLTAFGRNVLKERGVFAAIWKKF